VVLFEGCNFVVFYAFMYKAVRFISHSDGSGGQTHFWGQKQINIFASASLLLYVKKGNWGFH